jgi:hypothetical protein
MRDGKFTCVLAHRYAWEKWVGPIPEGHDLDHRPECPKNCVNIAHLQPLTRSEHVTLTWERARRGEEAAGFVTRGKDVV